MRFLIAAFGTRGDVQPAMAVALALRAEGHVCDVFVPPSSIEWVRSLGLEATAVGLDYAKVTKAASEGRFIDLLRTLPLLRHEVDAQVDAMLEVSRRADLVLGCSVFAAGQLLADLHHVPYRFLCLSPYLIPSSEHPSPNLRQQTMPRWVNRLSWKLNDWLWGAFLGAPITRCRARHGLPPRGSIWHQLLADVNYLASDPTLFPAASQLEPKREVIQTGPIFLDDPKPLSPEVTRFLEAGAPPIYVGFGSMSDPNPRKTERVLLEASAQSGHRLIVSRGWAGFDPAATPNVCVVGDEPHEKLFPRCAAVLHHGGIGTTNAALRAGVPQLVSPHLLDQFYTAHRIERGGVGLALHGRFGLSSHQLVDAFHKVTSASVQAKARAQADRVPRDGVERLVAALTRR